VVELSAGQRSALRAVTPGGLPARYAREKRRNPRVGGEAAPLEGGRGRSGGHGERRGGVCADFHRRPHPRNEGVRHRGFR
jgi:hypothetical protein